LFVHSIFSYTILHPHISLLYPYTTPPTTEIYTLSLHDALPICGDKPKTAHRVVSRAKKVAAFFRISRSSRRTRNPEKSSHLLRTDRKSTRLNSSHRTISYAVFCLKKKNKKTYDFNINTLLIYKP